MTKQPNWTRLEHERQVAAQRDYDAGVSDNEPLPPPPRQPVARCTYCGQSYYSMYAVNRASWEGCDNCGKLNTVEMNP